MLQNSRIEVGDSAHDTNAGMFRNMMCHELCGPPQTRRHPIRARRCVWWRGERLGVSTRCGRRHGGRRGRASRVRRAWRDEDMMNPRQWTTRKRWYGTPPHPPSVVRSQFPDILRSHPQTRAITVECIRVFPDASCGFSEVANGKRWLCFARVQASNADTANYGRLLSMQLPKAGCLPPPKMRNICSLHTIHDGK